MERKDRESKGDSELAKKRDREREKKTGERRERSCERAAA